MLFTRKKKKGFLYIMVLFAVILISIMLLEVFQTWKYKIKKEKEAELIFRGNQYVTAISKYLRKNPGRYPKSFEELHEKKFLRRVFKEPFSEDGNWNIVSLLQKGSSKKKFIVVPYSIWEKSEGKYRIAGVVSPVHKKGYKVYKKKEYYDEWLFAYGVKEEIPEFEVLGSKEKK